MQTAIVIAVFVLALSIGLWLRGEDHKPKETEQYANDRIIVLVNGNPILDCSIWAAHMHAGLNHGYLARINSSKDKTIAILYKAVDQ